MVLFLLIKIFGFISSERLVCRQVNEYIQHSNARLQIHQNFILTPKKWARPVTMHKVKVYTDRIMKAVSEEAKSVSTERFTRPVRIFAWKNKIDLSFSSSNLAN